jgi:hypothetical protein
MPSPLALTLARQRLVNGFGVEATETLVPNDNNRQRAHAHTHELLHGALITRDVFLCKRDTFLR